jgi:hypothetical protein
MLSLPPDFFEEPEAPCDALATTTSATTSITTSVMVLKTNAPYSAHTTLSFLQLNLRFKQSFDFAFLALYNPVIEIQSTTGVTDHGLDCRDVQQYWNPIQR